MSDDNKVLVTIFAMVLLAVFTVGWHLGRADLCESLPQALPMATSTACTAR